MSFKFSYAGPHPSLSTPLPLSLLQYNLDYYLSLAEKLVDHGVHALAIKVWMTLTNN